MQIHTKTGISETLDNIGNSSRISGKNQLSGDRSDVDGQKNHILEEDSNTLELDTHQGIMDCYRLKYQYDHVFVIGDNRLKQNVEVMVGKRTLYCAFHDTRSSEHDCEHVRFIQTLDKLQI